MESSRRLIETPKGYMTALVLILSASSLLARADRQRSSRVDRSSAGQCSIASDLSQPLTVSAIAKGLGKLLDHDDSQVRLRAAKALVELGPAAAAELPGMIRTSRYDQEVRQLTRSMLAKMDDGGFSHLARAVQDDDIRQRIGALVLLKGVANASEKHVDVVAASLRDKEPEVRKVAADVLVFYRQERSIPGLVRAVREDDNEDVRAECATALGNIGKRTECAAPALFAALCKAKSKPGIVAWALARTGTRGEEFLKKILEDRELERLHAAVLAAIPELGPDAVPILPNVSNFLRSGDKDLQRKALDCLRRLGLVARGTGAQVRELLRSNDPVTRIAAVWTLAETGWQVDEHCISTILKAIEGEDAEVRGYGFAILNKLGPKAAKAVPALQVFLKDDRELMRKLAARALGCIGAAAKEAVPLLRAATKDDSEDVQKAAQEALRAIAVDDKEWGTNDKSEKKW